MPSSLVLLPSFPHGFLAYFHGKPSLVFSYFQGACAISPCSLFPQMDRASEFVGRSLYVLESATMEAFRPVDGACRLDATLEINKIYFAALFRHMQVGHDDAKIWSPFAHETENHGSALLVRGAAVGSCELRLLVDIRITLLC